VLVVAAAGLGSSRLLAAMLGEADCSAGSISLLGRDVGKLRRSSLRQLRRKVGIVPQELCLLEDRSAHLNVVLPLEIDGVPRSASAARAAAVLQELDLAADAERSVDALSRSARQRVAVARALIRQPEVLLADHPTSDQDAAGAELVCRALDRAAAAGAACVVFSRDPMLRVHAEAMGWGQWLLAEGALRPLHDGAADPFEELEISVESPPSRAAAPRAASAASAGSAGTAASACSATPGAPVASPVSAAAAVSSPVITSAAFGASRVAGSASPASPPAATAVEVAEAAELRDELLANVLPFPGAARAGAR
jgi:cell division transport system ATP-binding protein